ncbi:MAG: PAS domain S-box protein [Chthoniobacterales bacterium]
MRLLAEADKEKREGVETYLKEVYLPGLRVFEQNGLVAVNYFLPDGELLLQTYPIEPDERLSQTVMSMMSLTNSTLISQSAFVETLSFEGFRYVYPLFYDKAHVANLDIGFLPKTITDFLKRSIDGWSDFAVKATLITSKGKGRHIDSYEKSKFLPGYFILKKSEEQQGAQLKSIIGEGERGIKIQEDARKEFAGLLSLRSSGIASFKSGGFYWDVMVYPQTDITGAVVGQFFAINENQFLPTLYSGTRRNIVVAWACTFLAVLLFSMSYLQRQWLLSSQVEAVSQLEDIGKTIPGAVYQSQYWPETGQSLMKFISPGVIKLFFDSQEKFLKKPDLWMDYIIPDDRTKVKKSMALCAEELRPWAEEFRVKTSDGKTTWREVKAQPELQKDGSIIWNGFLAEADDRKAAEKALSESEQRFRDMAEAAGEYLWETDKRGCYILLSHGAGSVFGAPRELLINKKPEDFAPPESREWVTQIWKNIREKGEAFRELEFCIRRLSGELVWVRYSGTPFVDTDGNFAGFRGTGLDVTREKLAGELVKQTQERLVLATNAGNLGVWEFSFKENKFILDELCCQIFDLPRGVSKRSLEEILELFVPEDKEQMRETIQALLRGEERPNMDLLIKTPRGEERILSTSVSSAKNESGEVIRIAGVISDITSRKRIEEQVRATRDMLESVMDASSEVAIIATDNNGIITVFNSGAEKMLGYSASEVIGNETPLLFFKNEKSTGSVNSTDILLHAAQQKLPNDREWKYICKNKEIITVSQVITERWDDNGVREGFLCVALDITERQRTEYNLARSEKVLRAFVEHTPAAVAMFDTNLNYIAHSRQWLTDYNIFSTPSTDDPSHAVFPELGEYWKNIHKRSLAGEIVSQDEDKIEYSNGQKFWLSWEVRPWFSVGGKIGGTMMLTIDVTDQKQAEQHLMRVNEDLQLSQRIARLGGWSWDVGSEKIICTEELFRIFGMNPNGHSVDRSKLKEIFAYKAILKIYNFVNLAIEFGERNVFEVIGRKTNSENTQSSEEINILIRLEPVISGNGNIRRLYGCVQDVSEMHRAREALEKSNERLQEAIAQTKELASRDPLTNLYNRAFLMAELERALRRVSNNSVEQTLIYIDLDNFKTVNDSQGHSAGDSILQAVSRLLEKHFKPEEIISRFGGDEFIGIFQRNEAESIKAAKTIISDIKTHLFQGAERLYAIGASIGVCQLKENLTAEDAVSRADAACYAAKRLGRNRVKAFRPNATGMELTLGIQDWSQVLGEAIYDKRFETWFQPIVRLDTGTPIFFEVLLRLRGQNKDIIEPSTFIPPAERMQLMPELDFYVIEQSARILLKYPNVNLSINLSAQSLAMSDMLKSIDRIFLLKSIDPSRVTWEITETEALTNIDEAAYQTQALHERGFLIALDDFGSGFSSFDYLRKLHIDFLKIDGSIIKNIAQDSASYAFTKAIHDIGKSMNLQCIAEYVETRRVAQILSEIGILYGQGFLFSAPQPDFKANMVNV